MGQSMGGYGALLAAERDPARYRAVAVAGPAIFPSYDDERRSVGDAFDSPADFARYDVLAHAARCAGGPSASGPAGVIRSCPASARSRAPAPPRTFASSPAVTTTATGERARRRSSRSSAPACRRRL